jgi:hypothetical protein
MTTKPATGALWGPERGKCYTLDQIKAAFWATFHESGELWFNYLCDEEENTEFTMEHWKEFVENLDENYYRG